MHSFAVIFIALLIIYPSGNKNNSIKRIESPGSKIVFSPESKMYLKGDTNINSYTCDCVSPSGNMPLCFENKENRAVFQNISLEITTNYIDCHQILYNHNIKKALDTERYPFIKVELLEAWKTNCLSDFDESKWFEVDSKTNVTIKNVTLLKEVKALAICISKNKYRVKGNKVLNMNDFHIDMPKFMMGMIKVKNEIDFNFDLVFEIVQ